MLEFMEKFIRFFALCGPLLIYFGLVIFFFTRKINKGRPDKLRTLSSLVIAIIFLIPAIPMSLVDADLVLIYILQATFWFVYLLRATQKPPIDSLDSVY
jgi:hypothetical protein